MVKKKILYIHTHTRKTPCVLRPFFLEQKAPLLFKENVSNLKKKQSLVVDKVIFFFCWQPDDIVNLFPGSSNVDIKTFFFVWSAYLRLKRAAQEHHQKNMNTKKKSIKNKDINDDKPKHILTGTSQKNTKTVTQQKKKTWKSLNPDNTRCKATQYRQQHKRQEHKCLNITSQLRPKTFRFNFFSNTTSSRPMATPWLWFPVICVARLTWCTENQRYNYTDNYF